MPSPLEASMLVHSLDKNKTIFNTQKLRPVAALNNLFPEQLGFLYGQYCVNLYYAYLSDEPAIVQTYYAELQKIEKLLGLDTIDKNKELIDNLLAQKNEDALLGEAQRNFEKFTTYNRKHHQEVVGIQILAGIFKNTKTTIPYEDFTKLQAYYAKVQIVTKQLPPNSSHRNFAEEEIGVIEDTIEAEVLISDQDFKLLCQVIQEVRGKYVAHY